MDRRRSARRPTCEAARIVFNYRHVRACTVSNISDSGACLEVASTGVPDTFDLIRNEDSCTCEVRWRNSSCVGVEFDPFFSSSVVHPAGKE
jgi:hypothetical protein